MDNPYATTAVVSAEERERLILEHLPQVRLIARKIYERVPGNVSLDDLISTGTLGLIAAIDRYDPTHNVKLKTYAEYKIRGAILDSLRGLDWAPRQHRRRTRQIERAVVVLEQRLQRDPNEEEIARELGIPIDEYHQWLSDSRGMNIASLESADSHGADLLRFVADKDEEGPGQAFERAELRRLLASAISRIPYQERTILGLYYQEELTLREIATVMKLHESRISQLKTQAVIRLRAFMQKKWPSERGPGRG